MSSLDVDRSVYEFREAYLRHGSSTMKPWLYSVMILAVISALPSWTLGQTYIVSGGFDNDYESWIERAPDGRLMVAFCRNPDWIAGDIYVTYSGDDGETWSSPITAVSRSGDQATLSFVVLPDHTYRLWYASDETGGYKIHSVRSTDGVLWIEEGVVDLGWTGSSQIYDPTVCIEEDSTLTMSYVVSGSGVFLARAGADGVWDKLKRNMATSAYRPRVMKHSDGMYVYTYHQRTGTSSQYDVFVRTSLDAVVWSTATRLTINQNSHDPFATELPDGTYAIYYAKYTAPAYNIWRRLSADAVTWQPEEQITGDAVNNTQPHLLIEPMKTFMTYAHAIDYPDDHDVMLIREILEDPYICGDANFSGFVDIDDVVFMLAYIFAGGAPPFPTESGDAECSAATDIDDVVYLITYIFGGGNPPCDTDGDGNPDC